MKTLEYFISYYDKTHIPGRLGRIYCRCSIGHLSKEGLNIFMEESRIKFKPRLFLMSIADIPYTTTKEILEHDTLMQTFEKESRDVDGSLKRVSDKDTKRDPNRRDMLQWRYMGIKQMIEYQKLAQNIVEAERKAMEKEEMQAGHSALQQEVKTKKKGAPPKPINIWFIKQSKKFPDKDIDALVSDIWDKLTTVEQAEIRNVDKNLPRLRLTSKEKEAINKAIERALGKRAGRN